MEAKEKIYLQEPTKVRTEKKYDNDVEYTRTDVFVEKSKKWFEEHFGNRLKWEITTYEFEDIQRMVEDFRKYMEE